MKIRTQRRLASGILKCGINRVWLDSARLKEIKEAITKRDIRSLINKDAIKKLPEKGISSFRSKYLKQQKRKGRRVGKGSRKGYRTARLPKKRLWINLVRAQRDFLKRGRDKGLISKKIYRDLYLKSKGGFFRSVRHIKLYLEEHKLIKNNENRIEKKKGR